MAVIYEDALKVQIKSGVLSPVYIILGEDDFLKRMYVDKITALVADKDDIFNYSRFGADCNLQDVYDFLEQLPVMSDKKCAVLCDYDIEHCGANDFEKLLSLVTNPTDDAVFVIWFDSLFPDPKKSARLKKLISKAEKGGGCAVLLNHRRVPELVKMLTDGAQKRGCTFEPAAAKYLVETAGEDISTLQNELNKLCFYLPGGTITRQDVDLVSVKTVEASVYNLSKHIFSRNAGEALKTLDELFFMRLEPMIILYTVSSAYVDLYRVFVCRKKGMKNPEIAAEFGYKGREFVIDRAAQNLSKFDFKKLSLSFEALLSADKQLKSFGADPRTVLEQLTVRLIYIIAKGESVDKA